MKFPAVDAITDVELRITLVDRRMLQRNVLDWIWYTKLLDENILPWHTLEFDTPTTVTDM